MALWIIEPAAHADDPIWMGRRRWREIIVEADTPAEARVIASRLACDEPTRAAQLEKPRPGHGLENEKLYHVHPAPASEAARLRAAPQEGPVLRAIADDADQG